MDNSIDNILSDEPVEVTNEPVETPEPEAPQTPRDEQGRFAPKAQPEEAGAPPAPEPDAPHVPVAALKDERAKRQALEAEMAALRKQIEAQQPKEPPPPPPSVWDDEQAYGGHIVSTAVQQASLNAHLNMSEMMARRDHEDFEAMKAEFLKMAEQNPTLAQQALADPDPWGKAYQIAKNAKTMAELGAVDVASLETKLREQIMAEMAQQTPAAPGLPPTLSGQRNVGTRSGPAWTGPVPLSDLLK